MFGIRKEDWDGHHVARPSRQCGLGVEGMETRALLSISVLIAGQPRLLNPGLPAQLNVAFDQYGHGFASLIQTNEAGARPRRSALLAPNWSAAFPWLFRRDRSSITKPSRWPITCRRPSIRETSRS